MTHPIWFHSLAGATFLSPTGACKPFDAKAGGYCRGQGIASGFSKKMFKAVEDGDSILGCIGGTSVYQDEKYVCSGPYFPLQCHLSSRTSHIRSVISFNLSSYILELRRLGHADSETVVVCTLRSRFFTFCVFWAASYNSDGLINCCSQHVSKVLIKVTCQSSADNGIGAPTFVTNVPSLSGLFHDVTKQIGPEPKDISVLEAHGTGTPLAIPPNTKASSRCLEGQFALPHYLSAQ